MSEIETETLKFTDSAARKVGDLIRGEGNPNLKLRVFVQGGGCSGMQYGFEFDEQEQDGDTCIENLGVKLLVDPMSVQYLTGAEIDYREGLDGAQFVIRNPNAQTTCGCGSAFSARRPAPHVARRASKSVPDILAAVDLGSNSFHMVVARYTHGQLVILDRLREMVRLGAGLAADGRLNKEVAARALACLERFGQRLRDMRPDSVRVVGTNVFRRAKKKEAFVERAREAIGHPIEIVSGIEEARLIYSGVSHTMSAGAGRRLVCDIGGGSTEIIIGEGLEPLELESLQIGCVRVSEEFFAHGRLSQKRMQRARVAARQAIEPYQAAFRRRGWDQAVGSSGTVRAIGESIRELDPASMDIGANGLERVIRELAEIEHIRDLKLNSLTDDRKLSFAGGVAILAE